MILSKNLLNIIFVIGTTLILAVAFGFVPREAAFFVLALYVAYILFSSTKAGVDLFVRSIPFFIALPIMTGFDNFNMWRVILLILFLKWAYENGRAIRSLEFLLSRRKFISFVKKNRLEFAGLLFFIIAGLSFFVAQNYLDAVKRLIYLINAAFLFVIIRSLIIENKDRAVSIMRNFALSGIFVVVLGFIQFLSAYFAPAWIFHYWWAQIVSLNMFGSQWANIVLNFGNTWFSYAGDTLRLRMFSIFPDSHSFPMYVIMTLPALLAAYLWKPIAGARGLRRITLFVISLVFINLALILTGTRGIWLSAVFTLGVLGVLFFMKNGRVLAKPLAVVLLIFILMFPVYFGIISFRQFQETSFTTSASFERLRSIIDFGETSNMGRIYIWKETLRSIGDRPLLGVGIGNFPVVLDEPSSAMRAGASAHNLYLHIASTIGIFGLLAALWFVTELLWLGFSYLRRPIRQKQGDGGNKIFVHSLYIAAFLFSFVWIAGYSLTDAALYDGRALLAFMTMTGLAVGLARVRQKS